MKYLFIIFVLIGTNSWANTLILKTGENKFIPSSGTAWVENAKVLKIQQRDSGFFLKAQRPGSSLLKLGSKTYQIHVLSPLQEKTMARLKNALQKTLNLSSLVQDGKIRVIGRLLRWEDWETIYSACEPSYCDYLMAAEINPTIRRRIEMAFYRKLQNLGLPPQRLLFDRTLQVLIPKKANQLSRLQSVMKSFGIEAHLIDSAVDLNPLVKIQITVAEVQRSASLQYGVEWPQVYKAQIIPKYSPDGAEFSLHALEGQGLAKILATPTILCRSGKEASFLAGGEFPIKLINFKTQDVIWKKYGILLKVSPLADFSGKMSIAIETEVSNIDKSRTVDGLPAMFTNRIQSHFDLSEPRTLALSGLIKSDQGESSQGLPGLSRIPILGALFGSKDFYENRTELVVFVRPEIVSPGSLEVDE